MTARILLLLFGIFVCHADTNFAQTAAPQNQPAESQYEYKVLAANKTSTLERELNEAGASGFRFEGVMGGTTSFGGSEGVVVMSKTSTSEERYEYKLLATNKTSTMQKELQAAGQEGYDYRGQTVFKSTFGGKEVVVIVERPRGTIETRYDYKLMATSKTSTMQKELLEAGKDGFAFAGLSVSDTLFGGDELVVILRWLQRAK